MNISKNNSNSSKGVSVVVIVLGIIAFAFIFIYFFGDVVSRTIVKSAPSLGTTSSIEQWIAYTNDSPKFSIKYPLDWSYSISPKGSNPDNVLVVMFTPKGDEELAKVNAVALRILDKKDTTTLKEWIEKYASLNDDEAMKVRVRDGYSPFQPKNLSFYTANNRESASFTLESATSKMEGLMTMKDSYIYVLIHAKGKAPNVIELMLTSLQ